MPSVFYGKRHGIARGLEIMWAVMRYVHVDKREICQQKNQRSKVHCS